MGDGNNLHFALILAAGFSTRMGTCKTTLPWRDDRTLLEYQTEQFLLAGIIPIVVLGSHNAHRQKDCPNSSQVLINYKCDRGKTSSILTGLQSLPPEFSTLIISAVDQPRSFGVYQTLLKAYEKQKAPITAVCYGNKLGHPLLFSYRLLPELYNISESKLGLREIVQKFYSEIDRVQFYSDEVLIDINDRKTYEREYSTQHK